jgi:hypothetical protein
MRFVFTSASRPYLLGSWDAGRRHCYQEEVTVSITGRLEKLRGHYDPIHVWGELSIPTDNESLVESLLRITTAALRSVSPYNLLIGRSWLPNSVPGDVYVLAWLGMLLALGVAADVYPRAWMWWLALSLAVARLLDLFSTQLGIVLVDRKRDGHRFQSIERSVILNLINIGQAILCFGLISKALATLFHNQFVFITDCHNQRVGECSGTLEPQTVLDFVYMSWGQMLTVGSKYSPVTTGADVLQMLTVASGLLLIGLALTTFIGGLSVAGPEKPQITGGWE